MNKSNGKFDEYGNKRSSWYGALYDLACGEPEDAFIQKYGLDDDDRAYIAEMKEHIKRCEENGIVPQFSHPFEG